MIKINLLPHKKVKPLDKNVMRLWVVSVAVSAVLVVGTIGWYILILTGMSGINGQIEDANEELKTLDKEVQAVSQYKKTSADLETKLNAISQIEKTKIPMTPFMSELNRLTTKNVWMSKLTVSNADFTIDFLTSDTDSISDFFETMQKSTMFSGIVLDDSASLSPEALKTKTFPFKVTGKIAGYENITKPSMEKPKEVKGAKKGGKAAKKPAAKKPVKGPAPKT